MKHLMVDLKTLDVAPSAIILQVGAVRFSESGPIPEPDTGSPDVILYNILLTGQDGSMSEQTFRWWLRQSEGARQGLCTPEPVPLEHALRDLCKMADQCDRVWSHGASFDIPIINFHLKGRQLCSFLDVRDTRTLFELAGITRSNRTEPKVSHRADWDAWAQAHTAQTALNRISRLQVARLG